MYRFYVRLLDTSQSYSVWIPSNEVIAIDASTPPLSLEFEPYGPLQLRATWLPPANLGGATQVVYDVWIDSGSLQATSINALVYLTPQLPAGTSHTCEVRAINDAGYSSWSLTASATALLLPTAPLGVTVVVSGALSLLLHFSAPAQTGLSDQTWPISSYEVVIGSSNPNEKIPSVTVSGPALQLSVPFGNLTKGNTYSFTVRASNEAGFGSASLPVSAMAISQAQAPFQFSVVQGFSRQIRLSWQVPLDVGDYTRNAGEIFYYTVTVTPKCDASIGLVPNASSPAVSVFQSTAPMFVVNNLVPDQCVTSQVAAVTAVGAGVYATQQFIPKILVLSNARIAFSSTVTGATVNLNVSFSVASFLGAYDMILIQFPINFTVTAAILSSPVISGLDGTAYIQFGSLYLCGLECSPLSPSLVVLRNGISTAGPGTFVSFTLSGIVNKHWAGPSGSFQIKTLTTSESIQPQAVDMALNVSGSNLNPGTLPASVVLGDLLPGIVTSVTFTFAASDRNSIPGTCQFLFSLGPETSFTDSFSIGASSFVQALDGNVTAKRIGQNQVLVVVVGGSNILPGSYRSMVFYGVRNQLHTGDPGDFLVRAMTAVGDAIDENDAITASDIIPGALSNVKIAPLMPESFALNTFNVTFTTGPVGLPKDAALSIFFPSCYDASRAGIVYLLAGGLNTPANVVRGSSLSQLSVLVQAVADFPSFTTTIVILSSLRNCFSNTNIPVDLRPTYIVQTLWTRDGGSILMEQSGSIPEMDIFPSPLGVSVKLSSPLAGALVNLSISLTTTTSFVSNIDGGLLIVEFPEGFLLVGNPSPILTTSFFSIGFQLTGNLVAPCIKQTWMQCTILTLALLDSQSWPYGVSVTLLLHNIQNRPLSGPTGPFNITSANGVGRVYDQDMSFQLQLQPNALKQASIHASPPLVGIVGPLQILFTPLNVFPPNCTLKINFPQDFTFASALAISNQSCDGVFMPRLQTLSVFVSRPYGLSGIEQTGNVSLFRNGGTLIPGGTQISLTLEGVQRRSTSGYTGPFGLYLLLNGFLIEGGSTPPDYLIYQAPTITFLVRGNAPTTGGVSVTTYGSNFGVLDVNPNLMGTTPYERKRVSFSGTASQATAWMSDSVLVSVLAPGIFGCRFLVVSVESQWMTTNTIFSFHQVAVSTFAARNTAQEGIERSQSAVPLYGRDFGTWDSSIGVRLSTGCMSTSWISATTMQCLRSNVIGSSQLVSLTLGGRGGTMTNMNSFDLPVISGLSTVGVGLTIFVYESSSTMAFSGTGRIGYSAAVQTIWSSYTSVLCFETGGVRGSMPAQVSTGIRSASATSLFSYGVLSISCIASSNAATSVISTLTFFGYGFATFGYSTNARSGVSECEQSLWISDSSLSSLTANGIGGSQFVSLSSGFVVGSAPLVMSYDSPSFLSISPANIFDFTGSAITSLGAGVGSSDQCSRGRQGNSAAEWSVWKSDSSVSALRSHGSGGTSSLQITTGVTVGTIDDIVSFNVPSTFTILRQNVAPLLPSSLAVIGCGLGVEDFSTVMRLGQSKSVQSFWVSDSAVVGYAPSGVQKSWHICITTEGLVGSVSSAMSYNMPSLRSLLQPNLGTGWQRTMLAYGSNLGNILYSVSLRAGHTRAKPTLWISDSGVECIGQLGSQQTWTIVVTCDASAVSSSAAMSYDTPILSPSVADNIGQILRAQIKVQGQGFGSTQFSGTSREGDSTAQKTVWISDSTLLCWPVSGSHSTLTAKITTGVILGTSSLALTYDKPVLKIGIKSNIASVSPFIMNALGGGMGLSSYSLSAQIGPCSAQETSWISDSAVRCKSAIGVQRSISMVATIGCGVRTATSTLSFDLLSSLEVNSTQITLKYRILGLSVVDSSSIQGCENGTVITTIPDNGFLAYVNNVNSSGYILGLTIPHFGDSSDSAFSVMISAANQGNTSLIDTCTCNGLNALVPYSFASCLSLTTERYVDASASISKQVSNREFGPEFGATQFYTPTLRFGGSACQSSQWLSSSAIQCKSPGTTVLAKHFVTTVSRVVASFARDFVYESLVSISPENSATVGGRLITNSGFGFGDSNLCSQGRLGFTAFLQSRWISDTLLACRSSKGIDSALQSIITVQSGAVGTLTYSFSYDNPQFSGFNAINVSSNLVTITGLNYGLYDASLSALLGNFGCSETIWQSETSIRCQLSSGKSASDLSLVQIKEGRLCSTCKTDELLLGCSTNSIGICQSCQNCPPGSVRSNCIPGEQNSRS